MLIFAVMVIYCVLVELFCYFAYRDWLSDDDEEEPRRESNPDSPL